MTNASPARRPAGEAPRPRTLVVLQPSYLPWLGYFDQMARADHFVYYDDVQFDKHGWRNRNQVKGPGGAQWLTVPVLTKDKFGQRNDEIRINNDSPWGRKHAAALRQNYARAPFLKEVLPPLEEVLSRRWELLLDLVLASNEVLRRLLGLATPLARASALGIGGGQTERLVNLCRHFGATRYLSGSSARDYLDEERFRAAGIRLEYQDYRHPTYPQLHGEFVGHLSVVDLLMNCGRDGLGILRTSEDPSPKGDR
ncbi:MAG: WbqC family protein [Planctomycetes bacterium]|nr:WbqC family protein [Planctomycetota bacterium]